MASKVVLTMPALAIYPFITWGLLFVALVYGLTVGALIDSADMRPADLGSAMTRMHHEVGCQFRPDAAARLECLEEHARNLSHVRCWNCSIDGTAPPLEYTADGSSDDWEVDAVMAFHFFGIIWIVHFIKDFCTIAMANVSPEPSRQTPFTLSHPGQRVFAGRGPRVLGGRSGRRRSDRHRPPCCPGGFQADAPLLVRLGCARLVHPGDCDLHSCDLRVPVQASTGAR